MFLPFKVTYDNHGNTEKNVDKNMWSFVEYIGSPAESLLIYGHCEQEKYLRQYSFKD